MDDRLNSLLDLVRTSQAKQREMGLLQTEIMLEVVSVLRELEKPISSHLIANLNTYIDDTIEDKISTKNMDSLTEYIDDKIERMLLDAQHFEELKFEVNVCHLGLSRYYINMALNQKGVSHDRTRVYYSSKGFTRTLVRHDRLVP